LFPNGGGVTSAFFGWASLNKNIGNFDIELKSNSVN
jgi:hypothetical protein